MTVDELIRMVVTTQLQRSNCGNVSEVAAALDRIGLPPGLLHPDQATLESLMKRRHLIVHRADKNPVDRPDGGVPSPQSLTKRTVETWVEAIRDVGARIIGALPTST